MVTIMFMIINLHIFFLKIRYQSLLLLYVSVTIIILEKNEQRQVLKVDEKLLLLNGLFSK